MPILYTIIITITTITNTIIYVAYSIRHLYNVLFK